MATHPAPLALTIACMLLALGCGAERVTSASHDGSVGSRSELSSQEWLDLTLANASLAVDASSPYPNDILGGRDDPDTTGVIIGEVAGPASLRTFPDSPFAEVGVSKDNRELRQYSFVVLPVTSHASAGPPTAELWIELGLVESPEEQTRSVLRFAPSEGTRLIAAGTVHDGSMVLPAALGLALAEHDGRSAAAGRGALSFEGEQLPLTNPTFAEIEERTRIAAGIRS